MLGHLLTSVVIMVGWSSLASADVFVRAPFVRVQVNGPGVWVRAPFVNIFVPHTPPVYIAPASPEGLAAPRPLVAAPESAGPAMTLEQFVDSFEPKPGIYQVVLRNPITGVPTPVRFTLPEGTPRQVLVRNRQIEFEYGFGRFVRIQFDRKGAMVSSR